VSLITSVQNPRVKAAAKLRDRRQRDKQGRMLIDGQREIRRAIDAGVAMVEVYCCLDLCRTNDARRLRQQLADANTTVLEVTPAVFERLAFGERADGLVAVAEIPRRSLAELVVPDDCVVGVLEGVEKPGNVGAVVRSADGAGLAALLVADPGTDLANPNTIRASLGTVFSLPVCAASAAEVRDWLQRSGFRILAARVDGSVPYTQVDYRGRVAIVLGSEAAGLSDAWLGPDVTAIRLPMLGRADSLNVSATAAVLFYEALRQRTAARP
jgi:RNA methyltransferase, TrmH family